MRAAANVARVSTRLKSRIPLAVKKAPHRLAAIWSDPLLALAPRSTSYRRLKREAPEHPVGFSEKLLYRMAHDRRPLLTVFADKVAVRDYVAARVGTDVLPVTYGIYNDARAIEWARIPTDFVLKASHGSGATAIVWSGAPRGTKRPTPHERRTWTWRAVLHPEDLDRVALGELAAGWLDLSYEMTTLRPEWAYADVTPRLLVEELLLDGSDHFPNDYKFFMFDGHCAAVRAHTDRFGQHRAQWLSEEWIPLDAQTPSIAPFEGVFPRPTNFARLLEVAKELSRGVDFVRVDLYDLDDRVVFGEMTNYPSAGKVVYTPTTFDAYLGSFWRLPSDLS